MKVLMVGAHQDDNEFRCGGLAHQLVEKGHEVRFLSLTNGSGGHHRMTIEETVAERGRESAAVAKLLGIRYDVWNQNDCILMPDLETRQKLIRYIREFAPDVVISHRSNDYHADHRAAGILVADASYLLIVPHECPDVPAMKKMPVILYYEDRFKEPDFHPDLVVDVDRSIDIKMKIADLNVSQVYEWLPYTWDIDLSTIPTDPDKRYEWLKGMDVTKETPDEVVLAEDIHKYMIRFARPAALYRKELIATYGADRGGKVRFAEAYQICPYGEPMTEEIRRAFIE